MGVRWLHNSGWLLLAVCWLGLSGQAAEWYNGDRLQTVTRAPGEYAVFYEVAAPDGARRLLQQQVRATLAGEVLVENAAVTVMRLAKDVDPADLQQLKNQPEVRALSPVYYAGTPQARRALSGGVLVRFTTDMTAAAAAKWGVRHGLTLDRGFAFAARSRRFRAAVAADSLALANRLYRLPEVRYASPDWWKQSHTRADDPLYTAQWHLENTGQGGGTAGEDANVSPVWSTYQGDGVTVAVVDDGLEILHEDLQPNVNAPLCWDFADEDNDPTGGDHGTSCAGVAAARGFNDLGCRGVAPGASLVGLALLYAQLDSNEATALSWHSDEIEIYSNSWGPFDDGQSLEGPAPLALAALTDGITNGRNGLGSIYVWAGGNGGATDDWADYDGYAGFPGTIAVAASDNTGTQSYYSEGGSCILVNAPSNGGSLAITTTDRTGSEGYSSGAYTDTFGGTSSAAPLVAGVVALMLEANPQLTWRDVQGVLLASAERNDAADADWGQNGAGHWVNHKYGFGRVDAEAAVNTALTWTKLSTRYTYEYASAPQLPIPDNSPAGISDTVFVNIPLQLEHVQVVINAGDHPRWSDLQLELVSPSGTVSRFMQTHETDTVYGNLTGWTFCSVRCWDEQALGSWTLRMRDQLSGQTGTLENWTLRLFGRISPQATGMLVVNETVVACSDTLQLIVTDSDLDAATEVEVVAEASNGDQETLTLLRQELVPGVFVQAVPVLSGAITPGDGVLQGADTDTVLLTYSDQDAGDGTPASVTETITFDCQAPTVLSVSTTVASVSLRLDVHNSEPATVRVDYGTACDALTQQVSQSIPQVTAVVELSSLQPQTTYFYRLTVTDPSGNQTRVDNEGSCFAVTTATAARYYTGIRSTSDELAWHSLRFTPTAATGEYSVCLTPITALPHGLQQATDSAFDDDDTMEVALPEGVTFPFMGQTYSSLQLNSNGSVSFGEGDDNPPFVDAPYTLHFSLPRVSVLLADLDPGTEPGKVYYQLLDDRAVVTWDQVVEWGKSAPNDMQLELFYDGRIRMNFLRLPTPGLIGLSAGDGLAGDFFPDNWSEEDSCGGIAAGEAASWYVY